MRHFIVGDIHGTDDKLRILLEKIHDIIRADDRIVFCGDYIDRGEGSFSVVEQLRELSGSHDTVFLQGNHEAMFEGFLSGDPLMIASYRFNGGDKTIQSYRREFGTFHLPESHRAILFSHTFIYEADDFYVVHAGFSPEAKKPHDSGIKDLIWIRNRFFESARVWDKTVIFGHTPTHYMGLPLGQIFVDDSRHLMGIDTGAFYGGKLTCVLWPDRHIIQV
jgi:serine/threonine protein phosphatase 1